MSFPALGQTEADVRQVVKRHYTEGAKAAENGQWEKARAAFISAWALKQHFQIAANLGRAELMTGRYRDAAEHLAYFLREAEEMGETDRAQVQALLEEAKAKVGTLRVEVDRKDAEVVVDGASQGRSPLGFEVFVEPGKRTIEARLEGHPTRVAQVDIAAGSARDVRLRFEAVPKPLAPAAGGSGARGGLNPVVLGIGLGTAAVATGVGVVALVAGLSKERELEQNLTPKGQCAAAVPGTCDDLDDARALLLNVSTWSFIGAGLALGGTIAYVAVEPQLGAQRSKTTGVKLELRTAGTGMVALGRW